MLWPRDNNAPWSVFKSCVFSWLSSPPLHAWVGSWNRTHRFSVYGSVASFCIVPISWGKKKKNKKMVSYIESTVEDWGQMLVLHSHWISTNIIETDRGVPGGDQEELRGVGAELHCWDAVIRSLVQLELVRARHLKHTSILNEGVFDLEKHSLTSDMRRATPLLHPIKPERQDTQIWTTVQSS